MKLMFLENAVRLMSRTSSLGTPTRVYIFFIGSEQGLASYRLGDGDTKLNLMGGSYCLPFHWVHDKFHMVHFNSRDVPREPKKYQPHHKLHI